MFGWHVPKPDEALLISGKTHTENGLPYKPENITVGAGGKFCLYMAFMALLNPGDEVLIPSPYWVSYPEQVKLAGGVCKFIQGQESTGFKITQANEESYLTTLADYMHGLGLGWIAKNLDDTQNASFVGAMEPLAQGIISEQCNQFHTCSYLNPFLTAGKWVGNAEYSLALSKFCASDNAADMNGIKFNVNLDGGRSPCR